MIDWRFTSCRIAAIGIVERRSCCGCERWDWFLTTESSVSTETRASGIVTERWLFEQACFPASVIGPASLSVLFELFTDEEEACCCDHE